MSQKIRSELGSISISENVIATVCGFAAMDCYGLVGMAPRNMQEGLSELLGREHFDRGIDVKFEDDSSVSLRMYIVVQYGVKISEVARNVQERVKYAIENRLGLAVRQIDVLIQSVRVTNKRSK